MPNRTFSPEQVQALIPVLEQIFGRLTLVADSLQAAHKKLKSTTDGESRDALDQTIERLATETKALLEKVEEIGGTVKDVAQGLVDFPGRRGDQRVCLCWRYGEKRLGFWHTEDEGFAGRKPLDEVPRHEASLLN